MAVARMRLRVFAERGVGIANESFEGGLRGFHRDEIFQAGANRGGGARAGDERRTLFLAGADERVWVGPALARDARPQVLDGVQVHALDLRIAPEEMLDQDAAECFGRAHRMLLRERVDGVLHRVGGQDFAVVALGVRGSEVAFEADAERDLLISCLSSRCVTRSSRTRDLP